jgi:hypothetical protein
MAKSDGEKFFQSSAVFIALTVLSCVVMTAGITMLGGTKVRKVFGASAESLAGDNYVPADGTKRKLMKDFGRNPEHGGEPVARTAADAGTDAGTVTATPEGQPPAAPAEGKQAQPLPESTGY